MHWFWLKSTSRASCRGFVHAACPKPAPSRVALARPDVQTSEFRPETRSPAARQAVDAPHLRNAELRTVTPGGHDGPRPSTGIAVGQNRGRRFIAAADPTTQSLGDREECGRATEQPRHNCHLGGSLTRASSANNGDWRVVGTAPGVVVVGRTACRVAGLDARKSCGSGGRVARDCSDV